MDTRFHFLRKINWENKGRLNFMSTPNSGIKKRLKENFDVYLIDEYNTSKKHYKEEVDCENLKVKKKKVNNQTKNKKKIERKRRKINKKLVDEGKDRLKDKEIKEIEIPKKELIKEKKNNKDYIKLHSVLTYKLEKREMGCINRDRNSVLNMQKIMESLIKTGRRPEKYTRIKKPVNQEKKGKGKLLEAQGVQIGVKRISQKKKEKIIKKYEKEIRDNKKIIKKYDKEIRDIKKIIK